MAVLDREKEGEYDLVAKATDGGGRSCQADILLMIQDMNDNAPLFSSSHYQVTVFDNTTVRAPVAVIFANDPDTGISFYIIPHRIIPWPTILQLRADQGKIRITIRLLNYYRTIALIHCCKLVLCNSVIVIT